jgi:hypothetical protein
MISIATLPGYYIVLFFKTKDFEMKIWGGRESAFLCSIVW